VSSAAAEGAGMRIGVLGAGYVGLVTGACLAEFGHRVGCLDVDEAKVAALGRGEVPIYEPGLDELVGRGVESGRLSFETDYGLVVPEADVVFVAVGTPSDAEGRADLSQVMGAVEAAAPLLKPGVVVVMKSTVPVGTTAAVRARIAGLRPGLDVGVSMNPEFLRQGAAVEDFLRPDRVVIGTDTVAAEMVLRAVYQPLLTAGTPVVFTNVESAELIKYASNAFLAIKLSFINEVADLCEVVGGRIDEVARGVGLDPRINSYYLSPGPGFGGSCLPKDTQALLHTTVSFGTPSRVVSAAVEANRDRRRRIAERIAAEVGGDLEGRRIAVLGLTFKANTDDLRESPAVEVIRELVRLGAKVRAYDPHGMERARSRLPEVDMAADPYDAADGADAVAILTEWAEFATLDLTRLRRLLNEPIVVDLRNLWDPNIMAAHGFRYVSVGRPSVGRTGDAAEAQPNR